MVFESMEGSTAIAERGRKGPHAQDCSVGTRNSLSRITQLLVIDVFVELSMQWLYEWRIDYWKGTQGFQIWIGH